MIIFMEMFFFYLIVDLVVHIRFGGWRVFFFSVYSMRIGPASRLLLFVRLCHIKLAVVTMSSVCHCKYS